MKCSSSALNLKVFIWHNTAPEDYKSKENAPWESPAGEDTLAEAAEARGSQAARLLLHLPASQNLPRAMAAATRGTLGSLAVFI